MQYVRGEYVIFADADGASKFEDLGKLEVELKAIEKEGLGIAVGSRAHMVHSAAVVQV
jgi:dolichyl-phosphate beta-glucosyltransferase